MNTKEFHQKCAHAVNVAAKNVRHDAWGFVVPCKNELEALQVAYTYRNAKHGCKIDTNEVTGYWGVTVWTETASVIGLNK